MTNEYIEREALRDELLNISIDISNLYNCGILEGLDRATKRLNEQPAADVAPVRHGRWINWGKSGTPTYDNYGTCSVCHEGAEIHTEHRNYCPNCGAKMDGGAGHGTD